MADRSIMNLVTDEDVRGILNNLNEVFTNATFEGDPFVRISALLNNFLQKFRKYLQDYENAYAEKQKIFEHNSMIVKSVTLEAAGKNIINILQQGYVLLQGIRETMVGDTIVYQFIKQYKNETTSYTMNLEQLLKYSRKLTLNTLSSTSEVADLQIQMESLRKDIKEELEQENISDDPLYNSIMRRLGKAYQRGQVNISSAAHLQEVYYQLKNIGFNDSKERKITRGVIYFYKMTTGGIDGYEGNLGQIKGGDSFLQQIKYNDFRLIKSTYLENQLEKLINAFSAPFDKQQFYNNMEKLFIQSIKPDAKRSTQDFAQEYYEKLLKQIETEKAYLRNRISKF